MVLNLCSLTNVAIFDSTPRSNDGIFSNGGFSFQMHIGIQDGISADFDVSPYPRGGRINHHHAFHEPSGPNSFAHDLFGNSQMFS